MTPTGSDPSATVFAVFMIVLGVLYLRGRGPRYATQPAIICTHCQTRGTVSTRSVRRKRGVDGGKATAAILTGGISLLAVGLSRKEDVMEARCANCHSHWVL